MDTVEETVEVRFTEDVVEREPVYPEQRTPEQLEALALKQVEVSAMYRPLARKSVAQLRRAEAAFLAANDNAIGTENEATALRNLYIAQNVAQYYKHALLDVAYAYSAHDLRVHEDTYSEE